MEAGYNYDGCPYKHAKDLIDAYNHFKDKYGDEFPELLNVETLKPQAVECRMRINETVKQQEMFNKVFGIKEMQEQISKLTKEINRISGNGEKKPVEHGWKMWRPDIKPENVPDAVKKLKEKHPQLSDKEIDISTNAHNNAMIKYKI